MVTLLSDSCLNLPHAEIVQLLYPLVKASSKHGQHLVEARRHPDDGVTEVNETWVNRSTGDASATQ